MEDHKTNWELKMQENDYLLWRKKIGNLAWELKKEGIIKKFNLRENLIRVNHEDKEIIRITYSRGEKKFYINLTDNFYNKENSLFLNSIEKAIKTIDKDQEIFVF